MIVYKHLTTHAQRCTTVIFWLFIAFVIGRLCELQTTMIEIKLPSCISNST